MKNLLNLTQRLSFIKMSCDFQKMNKKLANFCVEKQ